MQSATDPGAPSGITPSPLASGGWPPLKATLAVALHVPDHLDLLLDLLQRSLDPSRNLRVPGCRTRRDRRRLA